MDIEAMSVSMHQASLQNAVSISLMKMAMNTETQSASQMTDMIKNMAVDSDRGTNIDASV